MSYKEQFICAMLGLMLAGCVDTDSIKPYPASSLPYMRLDCPALAFEYRTVKGMEQYAVQLVKDNDRRAAIGALAGGVAVGVYSHNRNLPNTYGQAIADGVMIGSITNAVTRSLPPSVGARERVAIHRGQLFTIKDLLAYKKCAELQIIIEQETLKKPDASKGAESLEKWFDQSGRTPRSLAHQLRVPIAHVIAWKEGEKIPSAKMRDRIERITRGQVTWS